MLKIKILSALILLISAFVCQVLAQEPDSKKLKADEILAKARAVNSQKSKSDAVNGFVLNYKVVSRFSDNTRQWDSTETKELSISSDKIRKETFSDYVTNTSNTTLVLNGNLFERKFEAFVEGKKLNAVFNFTTPKEIQIDNLKNDAWISTFPIFLDSTIYPNPKFNYIGIAESKDDRADIIQTVIGGKTYQMFFQQETHFLLMIIETWKNDEDKQFQTKYFFSDYRIEATKNFAHKIKFQSNNEKIGNGETDIIVLKLNPTFKPNFFDVK